MNKLLTISVAVLGLSLIPMEANAKHDRDHEDTNISTNVKSIKSIKNTTNNTIMTDMIVTIDTAVTATVIYHLVYTKK